MTEEEARRLEQENTELKEQVAQKDRRIEELEARFSGVPLQEGPGGTPVSLNLLSRDAC